jgi:two-component sensor histidine kinase
MERRRQFAPDMSSVREARHLVGSALIATDDAAVAAVLASELTQNAVDHAATPFTVSVTHDDLGDLVVEVHDHSPELPVLKPLNPEAERGRGLQLVDSLAREWGVTMIHDDGKTVWFRLSPTES